MNLYKTTLHIAGRVLKKQTDRTMLDNKSSSIEPSKSGGLERCYGPLAEVLKRFIPSYLCLIVRLRVVSVARDHSNGRIVLRRVLDPAQIGPERILEKAARFEVKNVEM